MIIIFGSFNIINGKDDGIVETVWFKKQKDAEKVYDHDNKREKNYGMDEKKIKKIK